MVTQFIIVWDWNGTLLNDVDHSIHIMNTLLRERNLDLLDYKKYRQLFEFPVINYYKKLGFDFQRESFDVVGLEFMKRYFAGIQSLRLHEEAESTLKWFQNRGFRQMVLSAMEQSSLEKMLMDLGVAQYFEAVIGIDNHYGGGKIEAVERLHKVLNQSPDKVWMIGDTLHDAEIGKKSAFNVILVSKGHQDRSLLEKACVPVVDSLAELVGWFYLSPLN